MAKDFTFKQFHINAYQCGMPVSTDAILLGAWANINSAKKILDIGCGTGLLAIMCAQRNTLAHISAVEIEKNAFKAAQENAINCPWASRLSIHHQSIQDFTNEVTAHSNFDAIICNPPYFNNGAQSSNSRRAVARHTSALSHNNLLSYCALLLTEQGTANFVLPKEEGLSFINLLQNTDAEHFLKLSLTRLTYVKTTSSKPAIRVLIELTKQSTTKGTLKSSVSDKPDLLKTDRLNENSLKERGLNSAMLTPEWLKNELVIHDGQAYSKEFIELTKAFYLKM
ncbi:tRNA1(Val) (adenine(37)-N6)-methyltransferase [Psychromonas arctica]|uniref:tRNA1(Val) (adenine(37)-N6)-methyltransferase n=1 Tax=Psychromonas arctica TaxID=168275 RepID=UPI0003F86D9B|nr:methyltransferase [Psychromonas arctica]